MLALDNDDAVTLSVDPQAIHLTVSFWTDALSLHVAASGEEETRLADDAGTVRLKVRQVAVESTQRPRAAPVKLWAYDSQDLVAVVERLTALGAGEVQGDHYPDPPGSVCLTDPAGTPILIHSEVEARPQ